MRFGLGLETFRLRECGVWLSHKPRALKTNHHQQTIRKQFFFSSSWPHGVFCFFLCFLLVFRCVVFLHHLGGEDRTHRVIISSRRRDECVCDGKRGGAASPRRAKKGATLQSAVRRIIPPPSSRKRERRAFGNSPRGKASRSGGGEGREVGDDDGHQALLLWRRCGKTSKGGERGKWELFFLPHTTSLILAVCGCVPLA